MSAEIIVSILICSQNRAEDLRGSLASIAACQVPADMPTELLMVDNASTDHTPQVIAECEMRNLQLRPLHESRRGKSIAFNGALAKARGRIVLCTDDDVRVPANWIEGLCRPIFENKSDAVIGGVCLAPYLERPWLKGMKRSWLAATDEYDDHATTLIGANMAIARPVLERLGGLDPELGPGALTAADDVLLSWQINEAGYRVTTALDVAVEHHLREDRLTRAAFLNRARLEGAQQAYLFHHWLHSRIRHSHLKLWKHQAQLALMRLVRFHQTLAAEGAPDWELNLISAIAFHQRYIVEVTRPYNYALRGLRRVMPPPAPRHEPARSRPVVEEV
ncbi:MAG: glycosyltransferase [Phycisphaerae bacterium]